MGDLAREYRLFREIKRLKRDMESANFRPIKSRDLVCIRDELGADINEIIVELGRVFKIDIVYKKGLGLLVDYGFYELLALTDIYYSPEGTDPDKVYFVTDTDEFCKVPAARFSISEKYYDFSRIEPAQESEIVDW